MNSCYNIPKSGCLKLYFKTPGESMHSNILSFKFLLIFPILLHLTYHDKITTHQKSRQIHLEYYNCLFSSPVLFVSEFRRFLPDYSLMNNNSHF